MHDVLIAACTVNVPARNSYTSEIHKSEGTSTETYRALRYDCPSLNVVNDVVQQCLLVARNWHLANSRLDTYRKGQSITQK